MNAIPPDFAEALKAGGLSGFFADCTKAHQREYLQWIAGTKRPETRQARISKAVEMLAGKKAGEMKNTS